MKLTITQRVGAVVAAGAVLVGLGASAASAAPVPKDREAAVAERLAKLDCAKADQVRTRIDDRAARATTRISDRITRLTEAQAKAESAGRDRLADRIGKRIDRLNERLDKIPGFVEQAKQKVDEKCSTGS